MHLNLSKQFCYIEKMHVKQHNSCNCTLHYIWPFVFGSVFRNEEYRNEICVCYKIVFATCYVLADLSAMYYSYLKITYLIIHRGQVDLCRRILLPCFHCKAEKTLKVNTIFVDETLLKEKNFFFF